MGVSRFGVRRRTTHWSDLAFQIVRVGPLGALRRRSKRDESWRIEDGPYRLIQVWVSLGRCGKLAWEARDGEI
jgi:hypothetical protein